MEKARTLKILTQITAIFLWYFVVIFFLIVWDMNRTSPIFKDGTLLGDLMVRHPYQWDFELFFAGLFLIWGFFLWKAGKNIQKDINIIRFTGWAFFTHAVTMIIVGSIKQNDLIHLINDSIPWFLLGLLILLNSKKYAKI